MKKISDAEVESVICKLTKNNAMGKDNMLAEF